jgi:hypothetical protein
VRCDICRGACCEDFSLRLADVTVSSDVTHWLRLRGVEQGPWLTFDCRCRMLTADGRCDLYEDPSRPEVCREFLPGSGWCLDAVRKRRSPEAYARIRQASDPEVIHA